MFTSFSFLSPSIFFFFFLNDPATTEIYPLSLHDALPISNACELRPDILCLGKGLTGGYLPMSVTVASDRIYREFLGPDLGERTFYHGHSYGGNALAAAEIGRAHV